MKIACLFTFLSLVGCRTEKRLDDKKFSELASLVMNGYNLNDTLIFKSNHGNFDTIKIVAIDTSYYEPGFVLNYGEQKIISIKIQHLPIRKNFSEALLLSKSGKYDSIGNQKFISIYGIAEYDPVYYAQIEFRNIFSEISFEKEVDTMKKENLNSKVIDDIREVYWMKNVGLTGYTTTADETFSIQKSN